MIYKKWDKQRPTESDKTNTKDIRQRQAESNKDNDRKKTLERTNKRHTEEERMKEGKVRN